MPPKARFRRTTNDVSAGGVVVGWAAEALEIVLVGRGERWNLPKGTPELAESLPQTAIREVTEETGLRVRILEPLDSIHYSFVVHGVRHLKTVHFYLMESIGGDIAHHDWEYDYVAWLPTDEALRRISFPNEGAIIQQASQRAAECVPRPAGIPPQSRT